MGTRQALMRPLWAGILALLAGLPADAPAQRSPGTAAMCRFMSPGGPACVYGKALRSGDGVLELEGMRRVVRDLRPDDGTLPFFSVDLLLAEFEQRSPGPKVRPAGAALDAALDAAFRHGAMGIDMAAEARSQWREAVREFAAYRAQPGLPPGMPPASQDRAVTEAYGAIIDHLLGQRTQARQRMMAAATQFSAGRPPSQRFLPGPGNLGQALMLWLESTWDTAPVAHYIAAVEERTERELLLSHALPFLVMVPRQAAERERLVQHVLRGVPDAEYNLDTLFWAVRAAEDCTGAMRGLERADLSRMLPRSPSARVNEHETVRQINALMQPMLASWREHYCHRTLPHHHLAMSAAWKTAYDAVAALPVKPDDLIDSTARGRAARELALHAADLRNAPRVGAAYGLAAPPIWGTVAPAAAYLGFMGAGAQVVDVLERRSGRLAPAGMAWPRLAGAVALGAAYGDAYGIVPGSPTRVSERVSGARWQPCPIPVTSLARLYTPAAVAKLAGTQPTAACVQGGSALLRAAGGLETALTAARHAQCDALVASGELVASSATYAQAARDVESALKELFDAQTPEETVRNGAFSAANGLRKLLEPGGENYGGWRQVLGVAESAIERVERVKTVIDVIALEMALFDAWDAMLRHGRGLVQSQAAFQALDARRTELKAAQAGLADQQDGFVRACLP